MYWLVSDDLMIMQMYMYILRIHTMCKGQKMIANITKVLCANFTKKT